MCLKLLSGHVLPHPPLTYRGAMGPRKQRWLGHLRGGRVGASGHCAANTGRERVGADRRDQGFPATVEGVQR